MPKYTVKWPEARDRVYREVEASSEAEAIETVRQWREAGDSDRAWPDEVEDIEGDLADGNMSLDVFCEPEDDDPKCRKLHATEAEAEACRYG